MSQQLPEPPEALQQQTVESRFLKREIWDRLWRKNEHFMCVVVGREGSGKSHTGIKLASVCDPTFDAERVVFDPAEYVKKLREWKESGDTQGKIIVIDEAGVGVGVRTWHDKEQVMLNQVLQIVRDENMGVIFTLPRLEELDSQTRGRMHAYLETGEKRAGQWLKIKWLEMDPTRDGRSKIYREYPEMQIDGKTQKVKRLTVSPPPSEVIENYEQRKDAFQREQYENAINELDEDVDDERTVKEIAMDIADNNLEPVVSINNKTGDPYINHQLIRAEHDTSHSDAKAVKSILEKQFDTEQLQPHA